jgi:hypothetical protein
MEDGSRQSIIEVELDIFSGRPNPQWELPPEEADRLRSQLRELAPIMELAPADLQEPPSLGYRGFVIINRSSDPGIPRLLRVYNSMVRVMEPGREAHYGATYYRGAKELEDSFLDHARRLGYGDLIERFRASPTNEEQS